MTHYVITEEGLDALVSGKLKVERAPEGSKREFKVAYDSIFIDPTARKLIFLYERHRIFELELPIIGPHDTMTIDGLEGKASLTLS